MIENLLNLVVNLNIIIDKLDYKFTSQEIYVCNLIIREYIGLSSQDENLLKMSDKLLYLLMKSDSNATILFWIQEINKNILMHNHFPEDFSDIII